jgi:omega-amidase
MRLAVVQMTVSDGGPPVNLERAQRLIRGAPGASLYLLPELWTTGYDHASWAASAMAETPRVVAAMSQLAAEIGAWIGGSMISAGDGGLANRFWLLGPAGECVVYDKAHLFPPLDEPRRLVAGKERVRTSIAGWTAALSLCYDLRFPEMYRHDATAGAELFLVAAEWPSARAPALRILAQARALENHAYLALANRVGVAADGLDFGGGSAIIDPSGTVIADAGPGIDRVIVADLCPEIVALARQALPILSSRVAAVDNPPPMDSASHSATMI